MRATPRAALRVLAALLLAGCAELPEATPSGCGDKIVDANEDCDSFAPAGATCGDPGTTHACRFVCDATRACPGGYGCGVDGVCRARSDAPFVELPDQLPGIALSLQTGDFDADGRTDVLALTTNAFELAFFGNKGAIDKALVVSAPSILPAIGTLEQPTPQHTRLADDLVLPQGGSIGIIRGSASRTLTPSASSNPVDLPASVSDVRVAIADAVSSPGDEALVFYTLHGKASFLAPVGGKAAPIAELTKPASQLAGEPAIGRLDPKAGCEDLVLAYSGDPVVHIVRPCKPDGAGGTTFRDLADKAEIATVTLPRPSNGPPLLADVDHDGKLDLIANVACGADPTCMASVVVAFGAGDGTFDHAPAPMAPGDGVAIDFAELPDACMTSGQAPVLALGDFDEDGVIDFVTRTSITIGQPPGDPIEFVCPDGALPAPSAPGLSGTSYLPSVIFGGVEATVGHFGADGHLDVIAPLANNGLAFFKGNGTRRFSPSEIFTSGQASLAAVGDFDGDLLDDLAFAERGVAGTNGEQSVSIVFGKPSGPPDPPLHFGSLGEIAQVRRASLLVFGNDSDDDLIVTSIDESMRLSFSGFFGSSSRLLVAPLGVEAQGQIIGVAIGELDGDGHGDVAALGVSSSKKKDVYSLWVLPGRGAAEVGKANALEVEIGPGSDWSKYDGGQVFVAPDVYGPAFTVGTAPLRGTSAPTTLFVTHPIEDASGWHGVLDLATIGGGAARLDRVDATGLPKGLEYGFARAGDLDGDGNVDLVFLVLDSLLQPAGLAVVWNDGDGKLSTSLIDTTTAPELAHATDFALLNVDADPALEIVAATDQGVVASKLVATRTFGAFAVRDDLGGPAFTLVAVDADGDGVQDLAVSHDQAVTFYRGATLRP